MQSKRREITIQKDGLVRLKFPPYDEELLEFMRDNYPQELCIWKLENFPDILPTGFPHTSWYFEKKEKMKPFIRELKKEWDFEIVEEE